IKSNFLSVLNDSKFGINLNEFLLNDKFLLVFDELLKGNKIYLKDNKCFLVKEDFIDQAEKFLKPIPLIVLVQRSIGLTLEEIGLHLGVTRERVRQIEKAAKIKCMNNINSFVNDQYRELFINYDITQKDFLNYTKISSSDYYFYNIIFAKKDNLSVEVETNYPELNKILLKISKKNYFLFENTYIYDSIEAIELYCLKRYASTIVSIDEFYENQKNVLLCSKKSVSRSTRGVRTSENKYRESMFVLWGTHSMMRYYDVNNFNFDLLLDKLNLSQYEDVEITTLKLFRENTELMESYNILNEYELHNLLKKIIGVKNEYKLEFVKMPTLRFGNCNATKQIRDLLEKDMPISANEFQELYEQTYGVKASTLCGVHLKNFNHYFSNKEYLCNNQLSNEQIDNLKKSCVNDFYKISELSNMFKCNGIDYKYLNKYNLHKLGYDLYSDYVISNKYKNAKSYFKSLFINGVDLNDLSSDVTTLQAFYSELNDSRMNYEVIEVENKIYVSFKEIEKLGITILDLIDFANSFDIDEEFTITSLKRKKDHKLFDYNLSECFYANVLMQNKGLYKSARFGKNIILSKNDILKSKFISNFIEMNGIPTSIDNVKNKIKEIYNIQITDYDITLCLNDTNYYYDSNEKMIYLNVIQSNEYKERGVA
ncbi:MAG: sigma factor-like helix-turn-helix DNA-binding protein, partial [Peptostreptococcaceae bacterium]